MTTAPLERYAAEVDEWHREALEKQRTRQQQTGLRQRRSALVAARDEVALATGPGVER